MQHINQQTPPEKWTKDGEQDKLHRRYRPVLDA